LDRQRDAGNGRPRKHHGDSRRSTGGTLRATVRARPQERNRSRRCGGTCLHRRLAISHPGDRGSHGLDCSPKGDKPGFVQVEDDGRTLLIPDRRGNNRIDSIKNVVEDPRVALIFLVPGANETYRVNGRARVSVDPVLRRRFAVDGKEPTTVIVVAIEQAFQHCPKALVRSDLWKAGGDGRPTGVPTLGDFAAARKPSTDSSAYDADYARRMPSELY
jgi:PPOX class probable FMN-dependent enzyme